MQFGGNRARNLKCEITRPISSMTITNSWILSVAQTNYRALNYHKLP